MPSVESDSRHSQPVFISCVLPAYNEADNLSRLLPQLSHALAELSGQHEIIVVDDGSNDRTESLLQSLGQQLPLRWIQLSRNFGKEAAITAGLKEVSGDVVILMDADGQHPLSCLPSFLKQWRAGYDMIYGVRRNRDDESWLKRYLTRQFYRLLNRMADTEIQPDAGDFRLMDRRVVEAINALPETSRMMKGLYSWVGFKTKAVKFDVEQRLNGKTSFSLKNLFSLAVTGVTAFSSLPLRIWVLIGAAISFLSLFYGATVFIHTLIAGGDVPGWPTLTVSLFFLGGIQLLSIGIVGEYVARVFNEVKGRPIYIVDQRGGSTQPIALEKASATKVSTLARQAGTSTELDLPLDGRKPFKRSGLSAAHTVRKADHSQPEFIRCD